MRSTPAPSGRRARPPATRRSRPRVAARPAGDGDGDGRAPPPRPLQRLTDAVVSMFDFESWAPRSSRAWRLREMPYDGMTSSDDEAEAMALLNDRLEEARATQSFDDEAADDGGAPLPPSFPPLDAPFAPPITGPELGRLVVSKYGKPFDVALVRRDLAGIRVVAFNVMWSHVGQPSFGLSAGAYADRLDTVASILTAWGCAGEVRAWLKEAPRPKRGLPARPVVGNAVSLRLSVDYKTAGEWLEA